MTLLDYFGERIAWWGNCDVCFDPTGRIDGSEDARKVLAAAKGAGERFGAAHLVDIVRGAQTVKVARLGHGRLPALGTGADRGKNEWRSIVRQMVATGFVRLDIAGYGGIGLTDKGRALLRGEGEFLSREDTVIARTPTRVIKPDAAEIKRRRIGAKPWRAHNNWTTAPQRVSHTRAGPGVALTEPIVLTRFSSPTTAA